MGLEVLGRSDLSSICWAVKGRAHISGDERRRSCAAAGASNLSGREKPPQGDISTKDAAISAISPQLDDEIAAAFDAGLCLVWSIFPEICKQEHHL